MQKQPTPVNRNDIKITSNSLKINDRIKKKTQNLEKPETRQKFKTHTSSTFEKHTMELQNARIKDADYI